jgi:hypothetical protein
VPGPTFTCKVCGQEFWLSPAEVLRILPDHLDSATCARAQRRMLVRNMVSRAGRWLRSLVLGRQPELVIRVPMELVAASAPGPIDLLAPAYEEQLTGTGGGYPPLPLRWRRVPHDRLQTVVREQLALARRQGLVPEQPVDPAELRRWGRCRVVYPDGPGGARRAQGIEELTVVVTRR